MAKVSVTQFDFSAGELSPWSLGKTGDSAYASGLKYIKDFIPRTEGPLCNRPGTRRVTASSSISDTLRTIPFSQNRNSGFLVELYDGGLSVVDPYNTPESSTIQVVAPEIALQPSRTGTYRYHETVGDIVYYRKPLGSSSSYSELFYQIDYRPEADELSKFGFIILYGVPVGETEPVLLLPSSIWSYFNGAWYIGASTSPIPVQATLSYFISVVATSGFYEEADLAEVRYTYSGNVLYLTHRKYPPAVLYQDQYGEWFFEEIQFLAGPYVLPDEDQSSIQLSIADFTYRVSLYVSGADFSVYSPGDYISYRNGNSWVLAQFVSTDGSDQRAIVEPVKSVAANLDSSARLEYQATSTLAYVGAVASPTVSSDKTIFSSSVIGSWVRFRDIESSGTGTDTKWVKILNHLGIDEAASGFFYHGGTNPAEVDVVVTSSALTGIDEYPNVQELRVTDAGGNPLNQTTLLSSADLFQLSGTTGADEGRFFQVEVQGTVINCKVVSDAANSRTQAKVSVDSALPYDGDETISGDGIVDVWRLGAFYLGNYPAACAIFNERLVFAGTYARPETIWHSRTGSYFDFSPVESDGSTLPTTSFTRTLGGQQFSPIRWLYASTSLLVGTEGSFWSLSPIDGLYSNTSAYLEKHNDVGSILPPIQVGTVLLLVHRSGRMIYEIEFSDNRKSYATDDGTTIPSHLFQAPGSEITDIQLQNTPSPLIWIQRADGLVVSLTPRYRRDNRMYAIARHEFGSARSELTELIVDEEGAPVVDELGAQLLSVSYYAGAQSPRCLTLAPLYDPDTGRDSLFLTALRGSERVIEDLSFDYEPLSDTDREGMLYLDSATTVTAETPTTTWSGLEAYSGNPVTILLDGYVWKEGHTFTGTSIATPEATTLTIGYAYQPEARLLPFSTTASYGNTGRQGRLRQVRDLLVQLHRSRGIKHGQREDELIDENFTNNDDVLNDTDLVTGTIKLSSHASNTRDTEVILQQPHPYPLNILSITQEGEVE